MPRNLTRLVVMHQKNKKRHQLVFGYPVLNREIGGPYCERHLFFEPGQLFGLEIWEANDYGTVRWLLLVLRAAAPGEQMALLPQLAPGAEILVAAHGRDKVRRARAWLSELADCGADPVSLPPDYYRASHFKFKAGLAPRNPLVPNGKVRDLFKGGR
jgi:hypothetical protein